MHPSSDRFHQLGTILTGALLLLPAALLAGLIASGWPPCSLALPPHKVHIISPRRPHTPSAEPKAELAYRRAMTLAKRGKAVDALPFFAQAISLDPHFTDAYLERGLVYMDLHQQKNAIADYARAIAIAPNNSDCYTRRGRAYIEIGMYKEALADYTKAKKADPLNQNAYPPHAKLCENFGRYQEAIDDYTTYLKIDPGFDELFKLRAADYERLGMYDKALSDYTHLIAMSNDDLGYKCRADLYRKLKKYKEAIADYSKALDMDSLFAREIYQSRASVYTALGQADLARKDLEQAHAMRKRIEQTDSQF